MTLDQQALVLQLLLAAKNLEVELITDEDLLGSWPHQLEATNAQHNAF